MWSAGNLGLHWRGQRSLSPRPLTGELTGAWQRGDEGGSMTLSYATAAPVMLRPGDFQFGIDTAAYQGLSRSDAW